MKFSMRLSCSLMLMLMLALAAIPASAFGHASTEASASSGGNPIEGVWSFSGGAVAIQALGDGSYQGTVVNPTKFAVCTHPAGQVMWTAMEEQADGSFWGLHTWFRGGAKCDENPLRGLSAWRVLVGADGTRHLSVCFSRPGDGSQPRIDAAGKCTGGTFGPAIESSPLAPLPGSDPQHGPVSFERVVSLPDNASCLKRKYLKIRIKNPRYDPLREVLIKVNGRKAKLVVGTEKLKKPIVVGNLPEGRIRIQIVATTVLNERLTGTKKYTRCGAGSGKIALPSAKSNSKT
jgi:hypothetical protein